ncbi:phosphatase PAP2 family protein [Ornithinicoccus halotolerans]|uniref:phosphatase PAP2 family protein n=1 Tax=Ornithinicoccus halotolerans TaxID=1748220 RepID=UPI001297507B|nr:phosphatase PAP2 family protein [Ornithinicoccus halotolerans]
MPPHHARRARDGFDEELHEDRHLGRWELTRWTSPLGRLLLALARWVGRLLGPHHTLVLVLAVGAVLASTMTWLAGETYEDVADSDGVARLDEPLLEAMGELRTPWLASAVTAFTDLGSAVVMPVLAGAVMIGLAVRRRSWTPVILIAGAGIGSVLMTIAGKDLVGRARPPLSAAVPPFESSPSFPSGHSLNALVVAGVIAYLLLLRQRSRWARVVTVTVAAVFAGAMGLSRVFLGHHWFTDVLAAWTLGAGWLAVVITAHRLHLTLRHDPRRQAGPRDAGEPP